MGSRASKTPRILSSIRRYTALAPPRQNAKIALCVLVASVADGLGIATLLPLIAVVGGDHANSNSNAFTRIVLELFDKIGVTPDPTVMLGIVVLGSLLKAALIIVALRQIGYAVADVTVDLRVRLINSVVGARWAYYVRQPTGRFMNAVGDESTWAGEAYSAAMMMLSQAIQALVYLAFAALLSWALAAFTLAVSAIMIACLNYFIRVTKRKATEKNDLLRTILSRLSDVLTGIKPLKAMARQGHVTRLFERDLAQMKSAARMQVFARYVNRSLQEPIIALCLVIGIFAALRLLHLPLGEVIVMSLLLAKTVLVVGRSQQQLQNLHAGEFGLKAVQQLTAEAGREAEPSTGLANPHLNHSIEFRGVDFAYKERRALKKVNIRLETGQIVVLGGASGAGKTTFIDVLLGLHLPADGQVLIDGVPLNSINRPRWRSLVGYAPQEVILFHDTVAANVTFGDDDLPSGALEHALRDAECWDFVKALPDGAETVVGERGALLSGGQRQRLALARALVHDPRLLILDEATSALDPATEAAIIANVRRRVQEDKLTVVAVSHHPAWGRVADRVLRMKAGRLTEEAEHRPA